MSRETIGVSREMLRSELESFLRNFDGLSRTRHEEYSLVQEVEMLDLED